MGVNEKIKKLFDEEVFPLWGLLGSIAVCVAFFIPQMLYTGRSGESFSMLNHFVSELGEIGVSSLWLVFSIGLISGGFFYFLFMIGFGLYLENILGKIGMVLGSISAIFCMGVGFFPMNFLVPHYIAALSFFMGTMITIIVFTLAVAIQKEQKVPKFFIIPGIIVILIYLALNTIDFASIGDHLDLETGGILNRPEVWDLAIIEWAAVLSVTAYLLLISLYFYYRHKM